jgi:hypothetical protein
MFVDVKRYRPLSTGLVVKTAKAISTEDITRESGAHRLYVETLI